MKASILDLDLVDIERSVLLVESAYMLDIIDHCEDELYTESADKKKKSKKDMKNRNYFLDSVRKAVASVQKFIADLIQKIKSIFKKDKTSPGTKCLAPHPNAVKKMNILKRAAQGLSKCSFKTPEGRQQIIKISETITAITGLLLTANSVKKTIAANKMERYTDEMIVTMDHFDGFNKQLGKLTTEKPENLSPEDVSILKMAVSITSKATSEASKLLKHFKFCYSQQQRDGLRQNIKEYGEINKLASEVLSKATNVSQEGK